MQGAVLRRLLAVDVMGAADLYDCNWVGAMEPYVVVTPLPSRREARKTLPSLGGGTNPRWGAGQGAVAMELRLAAADSSLLLEVFNEALIGADTLLGQCEVPLPPGAGTGCGSGSGSGSDGGAEWAAGQTRAAGPAELSTAWGVKQGEILFTVRERGAASLVLAPPTTQQQTHSSPGKPSMPSHTPQPQGSSEAQARVSLPQAQQQRPLSAPLSALRPGAETHPRLSQIAPHSVQQASSEGQGDAATGLLPATPPNGSVHRSDAAAECATPPPPPEERPTSEAAGAFAAALAEAVERSDAPDHEGQCSGSEDAAAAPHNRRASRDVAGRSFEGDVPDAGAPTRRLKADTHPRFGKYRMMKKCKLPDGAIRQKMENDEMSEADIAIFLGADAAPAPAPAPAASRPKPAAAAPKPAAAAAKKASQAKFLKRGLQATPFGGGGGGGSGGGRPKNPFGGGGGGGKMDLLAAIQAKGGASGGGLKKVEAGAGVESNKPKPTLKGGAPAPMSMMEEMMAKQRQRGAKRDEAGSRGRL